MRKQSKRSKKSHKPEVSAQRWSEHQKAILACAHWQPNQAVAFCRQIIELGESAFMILVGFNPEQGWTTYQVLRTEGPGEDANTQAVIDRDAGEGYAIFGFYDDNGDSPRICLSPWFEVACALKDIDRQEVLDSLQDFLKRMDSGELPGHPAPPLTTESGWVN
jgi:hypothetical protein